MTSGPHVDEDIMGIVERRGISEVLHFTTNHGLLGILASRAVRPRAALETDDYLEKLFLPNAKIRRDPAWVGHVSLSISRTNTDFFTTSQQWHAREDLWWCVISLRAEILGHQGVVFCTVNNIWPSVSRQSGPDGLEALFAESVVGWYGGVVSRREAMAASWPTSVQAEVLYPGQIGTEYVQRVYVESGIHGAAAEAQLAAVDHRDIDVVVDATVFQEGVPSA